MNGKGDRNRTSNAGAYRDNYDKVKWGRRKKCKDASVSVQKQRMGGVRGGVEHEKGND